MNKQAGEVVFAVLVIVAVFSYIGGVLAERYQKPVPETAKIQAEAMAAKQAEAK